MATALSWKPNRSQGGDLRLAFIVNDNARDATHAFATVERPSLAMKFACSI